MSARSWYSIRAAASDSSSAEISIHDEIGLWGVSARNFISDLKSLGPVQNISLSIHSPGGEVFDGWAIFNALKHHPARVTARIEGLAASMASVIAMAADEIQIPSNAMIMIHNPMGFVVGDSEDMKDMAALLDKIRTGIVSAYAERTGITAEEITNLLDAETWMDGTEAVARGFADILLEHRALAAMSFDTRRFLKMPANLASSAPATDPVEPIAPASAGDHAPAPVEPQAPASEPAPAEDPPADPAPQSFLSRATAALRSLLDRTSADPALQSELESTRAQVTALNAEVSSLRAEIEPLRVKAAERDQLEALLQDRRSQIAEVAAAHGLSPETAATLPAPSGESSILDQFEAITDPASRTDFFRKHKDQITSARFGRKS